MARAVPYHEHLALARVRDAGHDVVARGAQARFKQRPAMLAAVIEVTSGAVHINTVSIGLNGNQGSAELGVALITSQLWVLQSLATCSAFLIHSSKHWLGTRPFSWSPC